MNMMVFVSAVLASSVLLVLCTSFFAKFIDVAA